MDNNNTLSSTTITLRNEFPKPYGRFKETDGPEAADHFRDKHLIPALQEHTNVIIDIEGTLPMTQTWIHEAFGGLLFSQLIDISADAIKARIAFTGENDLILQNLWEDFTLMVNHAAKEKAQLNATPQ